MPSREEIVHEISVIANWCEDQAASSALGDLARQVENMRCENCDYKEELLKEMMKLKQSIKKDPIQFRKQLTAIRAMRGMLTGEQREKLDRIIRLLEEE